ncbi:MAG TPA: hypothetical protein VLJ21_00615 [Candidatus Binatia bacterium]|nr:hypothetical protein [Candidatus Binatia bacterium]
MLPEYVFLLHAITTFMWFGITWFVQFVHYPLLRLGNPFPLEHYRRIMPWAGFLLTLELVTGIALLFIRPARIPLAPIVVGLVLLAIIWMLTWGICVPCHLRLCKKRDDDAYNTLLRMHFLRSVLWSTRAIIIALMFTQLL